MDSLEKTRQLINELANLDNQSLKQAYPGINTGILRTGIGMAEGMLPKTSEELDAQIDRAVKFASSLRSDPE